MVERSYGRFLGASWLNWQRIGGWRRRCAGSWWREAPGGKTTWEALLESSWVVFRGSTSELEASRWSAWGLGDLQVENVDVIKVGSGKEIKRALELSGPCRVKRRSSSSRFHPLFLLWNMEQSAQLLWYHSSVAFIICCLISIIKDLILAYILVI